MPFDLAHLCPAAAALAVAVLGLLAARRRATRRAAPAVRTGPAPLPAPPARELSEYWEPTEPDPRGQRQWFRRGGGPVPVQILGPAGGSARACVLDRSSGGLRLRVEAPAAAGAVVRLLPSHAPAGKAPVAAEVRWCRQVDEFYEVGCRFTDRLPPSVLLLFG